VTAISQQRRLYLASVALVAGVAIYAAVTAGLVQATAFLPVFVGMCLLERKRSNR
jgi:hypothetical protein